MTAVEFKMWLDGFLAAAGDTLTPAQVAAIRDQSAKVVTLTMPAPYTVPIYPSTFPSYRFDAPI